MKLQIKEFSSITKVNFNKKHFIKFFLFLVATLSLNPLSSFSQTPMQKASEIDSLLSCLLSEKSDTVRINLLNALALKYSQTNADSSLLFAKQALKENNNIHLKGLVITYNLLGSNAYKKSNYDSALYYFEKALDVCHQTNDIKGISKLSNNIGIIYQKLGRHPESLEYYLKSLKIKEELKDTAGMVTSMINISALYYQLDKFQDAIEMGERALALAYLKAPEQIPIIYETLGSHYRWVENYPKSFEYLNKAIEINKKNNDVRRLSTNYHNLAETFRANGMNDKALEHYAISLQLKEKLGNEESLAKTQMAMGVLAYKMGEYQKSVGHLESAKKFYESISQLYELKNIHEYLSKAYAELNNIPLAYRHLKSCYSLNDSIFSMEKTGLIEDLAAKYETGKKEEQISFLETENELKKAEVREQTQQKNWFIFLSVIVVFITVIIFTSYKKVKAAKARIEHLQREMHHRVKNNLAIIRRLAEVAAEGVNDPMVQTAISELNGRIASMAEVHVQLYQNKDVTRIDFVQYVRNLCKNISDSFNRPEVLFDAKVEEQIPVTFSNAVTLGLIINELLTNAFKYAHSGDGDPEVKVSMKISGQKLLLKVEDKGNGFQNDFDINKVSSYGLKLVNGLVQQLGGTVKFFNNGGANVEIVLSF